MASVTTSPHLPITIEPIQKSPSFSECRPFSVSATFFQPRKSIDQNQADQANDEPEEETDVDCDLSMVQMIVTPDNDEDTTVTATLIRHPSNSILLIRSDQVEREEKVEQEGFDFRSLLDKPDEIEKSESNSIQDESENEDNYPYKMNGIRKLGQFKMPEILIEDFDASEIENGKEWSNGKSEDENEQKEHDSSPDEINDEEDLLPAPRKVQRKVSRSEELEPEELVSKINEYERISTVGAGSFGRVILVRHKKGGEYYALKLMGIRDVINSRQIEHVHSEKNILLSVNHPFIVKLHWAYHDTKFLYMLFDYVAGGELFSYLRCARQFGNYTARFYTAETVLALEYLHSVHVVYRDLKPENILLDKDGHILLTDFGFAKMLTDGRTYSMVGTPEYVAPEIIAGKGHNSAVDWWSLGILIYELLTGTTPFKGEANDVYQQIVSQKPTFSKGFDPTAKDLIKRLLVINRVKRLGNSGGAADVKRHKWFNGVDWKGIADKKVQPPIKPTVHGEGDTGNYDEYEEDRFNQVSESTLDDLALFEDW